MPENILQFNEAEGTVTIQNPEGEMVSLIPNGAANLVHQMVQDFVEEIRNDAGSPANIKALYDLKNNIDNHFEFLHQALLESDNTLPDDEKMTANEKILGSSGRSVPEGEKANIA